MGKRIAFQSSRDGNGEIYVIKSDGSGEQNLTRNPAVDLEPAWSPDGGWIAFAKQPPRRPLHARARDRVACRISPAPRSPQTPLPTAETAKTLRPRLFRSCSEAPQTPRRAPETPKTLSLFLRCSEPPQTPPPTGRTRKTRSPQTRPRASRRSRRHSSFATTRTYLHLAGTVFREEAERMERLALGGSSTEPSTDLSESQDTSADLTTAEQAEAPSV